MSNRTTSLAATACALLAVLAQPRSSGRRRLHTRRQGADDAGDGVRVRRHVPPARRRAADGRLRRRSTHPDPRRRRGGLRESGLPPVRHARLQGELQRRLADRPGAGQGGRRQPPGRRRLGVPLPLRRQGPPREGHRVRPDDRPQQDDGRHLLLRVAGRKGRSHPGQGVPSHGRTRPAGREAPRSRRRGLRQGLHPAASRRPVRSVPPEQRLPARPLDRRRQAAVQPERAGPAGLGGPGSALLGGRRNALGHENAAHRGQRLPRLPPRADPDRPAARSWPGACERVHAAAQARQPEGGLRGASGLPRRRPGQHAGLRLADPAGRRLRGAHRSRFG